MLFLLALALLFILPGCDRCGRGDIITINSTSLNFFLQDKTTGKNLLTSDSKIRISDAANQTYHSTLTYNGQVTFYPLSAPTDHAASRWNDQQAFMNLIEKTFYVYLNQHDTDTIKLVYKLRMDKRCNAPDLEYLDAYYNGKPYPKTGLGTTFLK